MLVITSVSLRSRTRQKGEGGIQSQHLGIRGQTRQVHGGRWAGRTIRSHRGHLLGHREETRRQQVQEVGVLSYCMPIPTDDVTHSGCIYCPTFITILDLWHTLSHVITHLPSYLPTRMVLSLLHSSTCLSLPHANKQAKYCLEQHFTRYILIILLLLSLLPLSVVYLMYRQRTTTLQDSRVRWCRARDLSCHHDEWGAAWLQEHPVEGPPRSQVAHHYYYSVLRGAISYSYS